MLFPSLFFRLTIYNTVKKETRLIFVGFLYSFKTKKYMNGLWKNEERKESKFLLFFSNSHFSRISYRQLIRVQSFRKKLFDLYYAIFTFSRDRLQKIRFELKEYRMHGFKSNRSRMGTSKVLEKSCDNNFIFNLLENIRDSDLLIHKS